MAKPSILQITKRGNEYSFALTPAGKPLSGATERVCPVQVQPKALETFCRSIKDAVDAARNDYLRPGISHDPFVEAGRGLFKTLLAEGDPLVREFLRILRRLRTPLLISTDDSSIFWELLFDDKRNEFLGLHFNIGRRLLRRGLPSTSPRRREDWRWLMIANPNPNEEKWNLPDTALEARKLRSWLAERHVRNLDYFEGAEASYESLINALNRHQYDVIHYAGHTILDKKSGEYALRLCNGFLFPASSIRNYVRGSPIVFLNGCWTGIAKGTQNAPGSAEGLTDAFLDAGAQLVVGSLFEVPDAGARAFAEKFYELVLSGETVGMAVKAARLHVKENPEYAAAWACFVMYGDPCLRFNLRDDPLQLLLQTVDLTRAHFEPSCLRILEQALEYAGEGDLVATPHLFAAMVDGEDDRIRDCLREQGVPHRKLRDAFAEVFKNQDTKKKAARVKFSDNAEEILKHAQSVAHGFGRERIGETHLIEAFVHKLGGTTGDILKALGVDVRLFQPEARGRDTHHSQAQRPSSPGGSGPTRNASNGQPLLTEAGYSPEAWAALSRAIALAQSSGGSILGTPHLFWGMLQKHDGVLARAFRRFGIQIANKELGIDVQVHPSAPSTSSPPHLSDSAVQILTLARVIARTAQHQQVAEQDLVAGFVQQGGGSVGRLLQQKGLHLPALVSRVFLDSGGLDFNRMTPEVRAIVGAAQELGRQKGHRVLGRHHLLYALLLDPSSLLAGSVRKQGLDVERLADLIDASLPAKTNPTAVNAGPALGLSNGLIRVFCAAETEMERRRETTITERHLAISLLANESEDIGPQLINFGVRWRRLLEELQA